MFRKGELSSEFTAMPLPSSTARADIGIFALQRPETHLISIPSPLPELSRICSREHRPVFLALVPKDGIDFVVQVCRAQRHSHLNLVWLKFLPGSSVEPHLAGLEPLLVLHLLNGQHDCLSQTLGLGQG